MPAYIIIIIVYIFILSIVYRKDIARTLSRNPEEELIAQAFCELFVANCLAVRENPEIGKPKYTYRLKDYVDISLLNETEQCMAKYLRIYQSYPSLLQLASKELKNYGKKFPEREISGKADLSRKREPHEHADQYQKIIADALIYNSPVTHC